MAEIGSAFVSVLPTTRGFGSSLETQVSGEVSGSGKRLGAGFGKAFGAAAALGAGALIGDFLKDSVNIASDLQESTTKIQAIFGDAEKAVQSFADQGAKALGQSRLDVLNAASTFGTFGKAAGLTGNELAKFSTGFVSLSTDLASFSNSTPEEAVEAIGAALRGEAEPIRRFGVLLDDATLRNEALKLGLIETTSQALTPQQKVLAAQAAIYKQTSDAQGDFQRTSGGLANQQRILSAQFEDLKGKVGVVLLPAITSLVTTLNTSLFPALAQIGGFLSTTFGPVVSQIAAAFGGAGGGGLGASLAAIGQTLVANFLPVLQQAAATFTGTILPAAIAFGTYLASTLGPVFTQIAGVITGQVVPILASLGQFFYGTLIPAVVAIAQAVGSNLRPVFEALVNTFRANVLPAIQTLLAKFREYQPTIQQVIAVVAKIIGKVLEFAAAILGTVLPPLIRFAGFLTGTVFSAISTVIGIIARIISTVIDFGRAVVDRVQDIGRFVSSLKDKFNEAVDFVRGIPGRVADALGNLGSLLFDKGRELIQGLIDGIRSMIGSVGSAAGDLAGKIAGFLPGSPVKEGPLKSWNGGGAGIRLMRMLGDGIEAGGPEVAKKMGDALDKVRDTVKSKLQDIKGQFDSLASSVGQAFAPDDLFAAADIRGFLSGLTSGNADLFRARQALDKIAALGGSKQLLSELAKSGNQELVEALAGGTREDIALANSRFALLGTQTQAIGQEVATQVLGPKLDGVRAELREVRKAIRQLGPEISKAINGAAAAGAAKATKA